MKLNTVYAIGDKVTIDQDGSLVAVVTAVSFRGKGLNLTYDVNWFHSGSHYSAWIEEWRLDKWEG